MSNQKRQRSMDFSISLAGYGAYTVGASALTYSRSVDEAIFASDQPSLLLDAATSVAPAPSFFNDQETGAPRRQHAAANADPEVASSRQAPTANAAVAASSAISDATGSTIFLSASAVPDGPVSTALGVLGLDLYGSAYLLAVPATPADVFNAVPMPQPNFGDDAREASDGSAGSDGGADLLNRNDLATTKNGALSALDAGLQALYHGGSATAALSAAVGGLSLAHAPNAISADGRYVTIDATAADGNGATLLAQLQAIGLQGGASFKGMASGLLPVDQVGALLGVANLAYAHESGMITNDGLVTSQADVSMHADTARSTFGVDGTGIKIGVLSDSFATRAAPLTTMAQDIANGDLSVNTVVLADSPGGTDEGRAMAQIIHDSAPGAAILFATAFGGQANFANNIIALRNAGAQVIVDDVFYFYEPAFQDGVIAQAVDQVVANGATYFSSAGNQGHAGYESRFINGGPGTLGGVFEPSIHNFGTTVGGVASTLLQITQPGTTTYTFQWANAAASASPGVGAISDLDFAGYSDAAATNQIFAFTSNDIGGDPINDLTLTGAATFYLRVGLFEGPAPAALKIVALNPGVTYGANITNINGGTTSGHSSAAGAIAVGAADYRQTPAFGVAVPVVETFSSGGPTNIWVDNAGNILSAPQVRMGPSITAPDGVDTSFFGGDTTDPGSFPNFFGTSASAPAAAAAAALLLQQRPGLTVSDVRNLLMDSAIDMNNPGNGAGADPGFDFGTGAGLIQANVAAGYASNLIFTSDSAHPNLIGTHFNDSFVRTTGARNVMDGADGVDTLSYADSGFTALNVNLSTQIAASGSVRDSVRNFENVIGTPSADTITGNSDSNVLTGGNGGDSLNGLGGVDFAIFSGLRAAYTLTALSSKSVSVSGPDGTDTVTNVERLVFDDTTVAWAPQVTDFNGEGKADFLWQNDSGQAAIWLLNGTNPTAQAFVSINPGPSWHVKSSGDFNGDANADILWQNDNGQANVWLMNGTSTTGGTNVGGNPGSTWHVMATGDVNGDGRADILWQNDSGQAHVWLINGTSVLSQTNVSGNPGPTWHIIDAADFNADGFADILWQNDNGQAAIWLMEGTKPPSQFILSTNPGPSWHIKAAGDFNADGFADILWQNDNGQANIWLMNGATTPGGVFVDGNPGTSWHVKDAADVNADGNADILWQNDNGQAHVWLMNGTTVLSQQNAGGNPGADWHLIA